MTHLVVFMSSAKVRINFEVGKVLGDYFLRFFDWVCGGWVGVRRRLLYSIFIVYLSYIYGIFIVYLWYVVGK